MRIKFSRMNFETECMNDIIHNRGFLISDVAYSDVDKTIKNMDGPRSPRFGTTFNDANEFMERFRCECGRTIGAAFEGETCPYCHTKVESKDVDILYTAWLNFSPFKVVNP